MKAECEANRSVASALSLVPSIIVTRSFKQIAISLQILITRYCQLITSYLDHENIFCSKRVYLNLIYYLVSYLDSLDRSSFNQLPLMTLREFKIHYFVNIYPGPPFKTTENKTFFVTILKLSRDTTSLFVRQLKEEIALWSWKREIQFPRWKREIFLNPQAQSTFTAVWPNFPNSNLFPPLQGWHMNGPIIGPTLKLNLVQILKRKISLT